MNEGTNFFSAKDTGEVAGDCHIENDDWHIAFGAKGESRLVHHLKMLAYGFVKGQAVVFDGRGVFFGIGGIDSIYACALKDGVSMYFKGTEGGA